ncbi:MAG: hypothetical protein F4X65_08895, partial [Chloroflexi bacterium]|nr:hypothetical protein [Chloroflexota bacterium]
MAANYIKWLLALSVTGIALANLIWLTGLSSGLYAATYALISSAVLFVRLLPGQGNANRSANFVLGFTGSITTFLAARYWLQGEGGIQSLAHASVVASVFLIIALVVIITATFPAGQADLLLSISFIQPTGQSHYEWYSQGVRKRWV